MFTIIPITNWSDKRDSAYRVAPTDKLGYRNILINPNRISDMVEGDDSTILNPTVRFKFFDNYLDRRESWSVIKANTSVAAIQAADDTPFFSNMITLPIHRNNDPDKATVDTTIPVSALAYADKYNRDDEHIWVIFYNAAFKRREVLTHLTLEQLEDIAETGTTSTTSTTTTSGQ